MTVVSDFLKESVFDFLHSLKRKRTSSSAIVFSGDLPLDRRVQRDRKVPEDATAHEQMRAVASPGDEPSSGVYDLVAVIAV
jgi:hypothetical protein